MFVEQTEKELWQLFKSIDRDHNGQLDKGEVRSAFERAGIKLPGTKLDQFFSEVDTNHDGVITFDEWRYPDVSLRILLYANITNSKGLSAVHPGEYPEFTSSAFLLFFHRHLQSRGGCAHIRRCCGGTR